MNKGWIGVDFDGTLAEYHGWSGWRVFGQPIPRMVERIRAWLDEGREVRIFTARITQDLDETHRCRVLDETYTGHDMYAAIANYCMEHVGQSLAVTCVKDGFMVELWDDRAVQVVPNTGMTVAEDAAARYDAATQSDSRSSEA